jgi:hypothetical protein
MKTAFAAALLAALSTTAFAMDSYHEDFSDGLAQRWVPQQEDVYSVQPSVTGNLHYHAAAAADLSQLLGQVSQLRSRPLSDFTYSVRIVDNAVRPTYMIFRSTPDFAMRYDTGTGVTTFHGSGYAFGLACIPDIRSMYYFYKVVDGELTVIQSWTSAPMSCTGDIDHADRLQVVAHGAEIDLYVNGSQVDTYVDPSPIRKGLVGVYNISDTLYDTWSDFDNVILKALPPSAAAKPAQVVHPQANAAAAAYDASGRRIGR